jgi:hypothetical protein
MVKANNLKKMQPILLAVAAVVVVYLLFQSMEKSDYSIKNMPPSTSAGPSAAPGEAGNVGMNNGTGLASSLLPREVASDEDFGQFAPEDILKGQNFLEPRKQIGFPETIGGNLRNANQQIRADPPNPKDPFVWNNSTIVPDTMQRSLCA